jgi:hypothetical protein
MKRDYKKEHKAKPKGKTIRKPTTRPNKPKGKGSKSKKK